MLGVSKTLWNFRMSSDHYSNAYSQSVQSIFGESGLSIENKVVHRSMDVFYLLFINQKLLCENTCSTPPPNLFFKRLDFGSFMYCTGYCTYVLLYVHTAKPGFWRCV